MQIIKVKIIGTRPLLMHSDIFADPLNPMTKAHKELTIKKKKTDDDYEAIAKGEWRAGLYFDEQLGPYLPGTNIESALVAGGKLSRLGTQLKRSIEVVGDRHKLEYSGPRSVAGLWEKRFYDMRTIKVQQNRIPRYRPLFREWATVCEIAFDPEAINREQVIKCLEDAGQYCGIGDYRPKFGRFRVEVVQ